MPGANTLIAKKRGSETWIRYEGQLLCKLSSFDTLQDGGKMPLGCVCILPGQMQDCPHPSRERLKQLCLLQGVQVWGAGTDWTLQPAWGTQQSTCGSKLIHHTPHGLCELSRALLCKEQNRGGVGELNWGCCVPSAALESSQARCKAKATVRDRNRNGVS